MRTIVMMLIVNICYDDDVDDIDEMVDSEVDNSHGDHYHLPL